jgi:hypothetical protein
LWFVNRLPVLFLPDFVGFSLLFQTLSLRCTCSLYRNSDRAKRAGSSFFSSCYPFSRSLSLCDKLSILWDAKRGNGRKDHEKKETRPKALAFGDVGCLSLEIASAFGCLFLIRSNFRKTTYDISLDSWISFLPLGFSPASATAQRQRESIER